MWLTAWPTWLLLVVSCSADTSVVVDLGYGLWRGTFNITGDYYNFSSIRYAQPPVGDLRFAPPQRPVINRTIINDGQDGRICPQGFPKWQQERNLFVKAYLSNPNNISAFTMTSPPGSNVSISQAPNDGRTNEDCLFLNVIVPRKVYEKGCKAKAPVLVWSYGGGFYSGSAESQGNPAGLITRSMADPSSAPGIVYVAFNYRLGAMGWLAGSNFTTSGGTPNAGLYDQRLVLNWVQEHIHRFGGDPRRVTSSGESAGASMNLHQITAFGNCSVALFHQAFLFSPAFNPNPYNQSQELVYERLLAAANATSLGDLRKLTSAQMIAVNEAAIFQAPYGASGFGPVVGDSFTPQLPDILLAQGRHAKNLKSLVVAHNTFEGFLFTNPSVQTPAAFDTYVNSTLLPAISAEAYDQLLDLYPAQFNDLNALGYNDSISRLATVVGDFFINCNANSLAKAFPDRTRALLFAEGAGLHGADTPYVFVNGLSAEEDFNLGPVNITVAHEMQDWLIRYVATGSPSLPMYEPGRTMALASDKGLGVNVMDPAQQARCDFWQQAKWLSKK